MDSPKNYYQTSNECLIIMDRLNYLIAQYGLNEAGQKDLDRLISLMKTMCERIEHGKGLGY